MSMARQHSQPANTPERSAQPPEAAEEARSAYGSVPGAEFPRAVYISVLLAFGWIMVASWLAFARDTEADLALGIALVLGLLFFALPILLCRSARSRSTEQRQTLNEFFGSHVETATCRLSGAEAWLQVLVIPLTLAFAAAAFGAVFIWVA